MGLGDLATGLVDAYKGNQSSSNLQGFLSKFNSSSGLYSNTIDPLNTFDIRFKFFPGKKDEKRRRMDGELFVISYQVWGNRWLEIQQII